MAATREQKFVAAMIFAALYVFLGWKFASGEDCVVTVRDGAVTVEYFQQLGECSKKTKAKEGKKAAVKKKPAVKKAVVAKKAVPAKPAVKEDRERREEELAAAFQAGTVTHEGGRQEVEERIPPPPLPQTEESAVGRKLLIGALSAASGYLMAAPEPVVTKVLGALLGIGTVFLVEDKTDAAVAVGAGAAGAIAGGVARHKAAPAKKAEPAPTGGGDPKPPSGGGNSGNGDGGGGGSNPPPSGGGNPAPPPSGGGSGGPAPPPVN